MFIPRSTTNLGQREHDAPDLTLVAEAIFADDLQFGVARIIMLEKTIDVSAG